MVAAAGVYTHRSVGGSSTGKRYDVRIPQYGSRSRAVCDSDHSGALEKQDVSVYAAYYTLRQIYSARMLLFGIVDIFLVTVFCGAAALSLSLSLTDLLTQFLFPMAVTACICFGIFCSRRAFSETAAVGMCAVWSAVWWFILLNEQIYAAVTLPVWAALFGAALLFICFAVCRSIRRCGSIWEEYSDGTQNDKTYEAIR